MHFLAGSWRSNLWKIRQGNLIHSWQNPCSPSGYDPDRCPKWILTGSVIILSEEDLDLFQKNLGEDPDWSGWNLENRNCKDLEQDCDLILLRSCSITILAEPFGLSPGMIRNETRDREISSWISLMTELRVFLESGDGSSLKVEKRRFRLKIGRGLVASESNASKSTGDDVETVLEESFNEPCSYNAASSTSALIKSVIFFVVPSDTWTSFTHFNLNFPSRNWAIK